MSEAFTGRSVMSYGDVIFKNEVVNPNALDDRSGLRGPARRVVLVELGWASGARALRPSHVAQERLQDGLPRPGAGHLSARSRQRWVQAARSGGAVPEAHVDALIGGAGANASALAPYSVTGCFFNAKAILYDANALTYQFDSRGALVNGRGRS
jgi:hypothetical protein